MEEWIDVLLVNKGIITSRERAKTSIMAGEIFVNERRIDKAGEKVPVDANIEFKGKKLKYVSRGGLKLEKAMKEFPIDLNNKVCMDIGASTGGFTDCMLQNGANVRAVQKMLGNQVLTYMDTYYEIINSDKINFIYRNTHPRA